MSSTASTARRMSAPFLPYAAAGNSWTRSTARLTSWPRYSALTGADQSAYARVSTSVPKDEAKSMMAPTSTVARASLSATSGSASRSVVENARALSRWNWLRPFTWSYLEITMLSKSR